MIYFVRLSITSDQCGWGCDCPNLPVAKCLLFNDDSNNNFRKRKSCYFNVYDVCKYHIPNEGDSVEVTLRYFIKLFKLYGIDNKNCVIEGGINLNFLLDLLNNN